MKISRAGGVLDEHGTQGRDAVSPVAWLSLDEQNNDFPVFADAVLAALRTAGDAPTTITEAATTDMTDMTDLAAGDLTGRSAINAVPPGPSLVLDDLHVITDPTVLDYLTQLTRRNVPVHLVPCANPLPRQGFQLCHGSRYILDIPRHPAHGLRGAAVFSLGVDGRRISAGPAAVRRSQRPFVVAAVPRLRRGSSPPRIHALHGWMDAGERQSRLTCGGCGNTWTGLSRCHCSCCHQTFATVGVFDRHQVAARCIDPARIPARRAGGIWFEDTGRDPAALFD